MVTICIKTFERYPCLYRLIDSIRSVHPKIKIIIADDSINYENINLPNVHQFKMPPAIGFNNGKNLAISQVTNNVVFYDFLRRLAEIFTKIYLTYIELILKLRDCRNRILRTY